MVVTFDDVTRLRQAEQRTRRLAAVVTDSNDAVILFDTDGKIQAWNRGAQALYGWTEREALRMNARDFALAEDDAANADLIRRLLAGEAIASLEAKRRARDGRVLDVWLTITAVLDESKKFAAIATTERDITERKRAEKTLREEEQFRRAVLDSLPAKVAVLDSDGVVISVNERWKELDVGTNYLEFSRQAAASGEANAAASLALIESVLKGERLEGHIEYPCPTPTKQQWFLMQVIHASEHVGGAIVTHVDITARKRAEDALKIAAEDLRRSNHDLEQFAYAASHDLQEPLRQVSGFMQLIKDRYQGKLDAAADQYIHYAVDGASRMSRLIDDLLEYSRLGTRAMEPRPVACEQILAQTLHYLQANISENGAGIMHDELPTVSGDSRQMLQLFHHLIDNALKFRREGVALEIHVGARRDGNRWVLSVRDNGIGIEADQFERVFQVFTRLHAIGKYPGSGIGLAICKKIVERHGGKIWVESKPGEGSTFYFTLPGGAADNETAAKGPIHIPPSHPIRYRLARCPAKPPVLSCQNATDI